MAQKSAEELFRLDVAYKNQKIGIYYFETQEEAKQFGTACAMFAQCIERDMPNAEIEKYIGQYISNEVYNRFFIAYANAIRLLNKGETK